MEPTDTDEWSDLAEMERRFLEHAEAVLRARVEQFEPCTFLGIAYRGVVTHGGRAQRVLLGATALPASRPEVVKRLIDVYLGTYGKATTFNNLVLETLWSSLEPGCAPPSVQLVLGGAESAVRTAPENSHQVEIHISDNLLRELGSEEPTWRDLLDAAESELDDTNLQLIGRSLLAPIRARVESAVEYTLFEEKDFARTFVSLVAGKERTTAPQAVSILESWLGAFQGLQLLIASLGNRWVTVPLRPSVNLPPHTPLPISALSLATRSDLPTTAALREVALQIEVNAAVEALAGRVLAHSKRDEQHFFRKLGKQFPSIRKNLTMLRHVRELPQLLRLCQKLVGLSHEGKPLTFTLLCAPDRHLLRMHRGKQQWSLTELHAFSPDPPDKSLDVEDVVRQMENNAFILQDPGKALFFTPHSIWPTAIVQFRPFDEARTGEYLRDFTSAQEKVDLPALAVRILPSSADLYADGRLIARFKKNEWTPVTRDLLGPSGHETILTEIKALQWWGEVESVKQAAFEARLVAVAKAAVEVARKGYGALFFLVKTTPKSAERPMMTTMAPVWAARRQVEHEDPAWVAAFAGLDGETFVDMENGSYLTRQFAVIPGKSQNFLVPFSPEGAQTSDFKDYLASYEDYLRQKKVHSETIKDWREGVAQFGTRHMKALRVSRAYPDSTIALTISSNGPLRLWARGFPVVL